MRLIAASIIVFSGVVCLVIGLVCDSEGAMRIGPPILTTGGLCFVVEFMRSWSAIKIWTFSVIGGFALIATLWWPWNEQYRVIRDVRSIGGTVDFDSSMPTWLCSLLGADALSGIEHAVEIDLSESFATDADLQGVGQLHELRDLSLAHTAVTDVGLSHLSRLKRLRRLHLSGTYVTSAGIRALRTAIPDCEITWTGSTRRVSHGSPRDSLELLASGIGDSADRVHGSTISPR